MKKQNLIPTDFLFNNRHIKIKKLKKSLNKQSESENPLKFQSSEIRGKSKFFKTDFCKNPNPHPIQKFDGLPPLIMVSLTI